MSVLEGTPPSHRRGRGGQAWPLTAQSPDFRRPQPGLGEVTGVGGEWQGLVKIAGAWLWELASHLGLWLM